jgi:Transposase DDE domain group 1
VSSIRVGRRRRRQVRVGAPDRALTANAGLAAVTELCDRLGVVEELDAAVGPIKQRDRGFGAGELLTGIAAAQLAGEDFLVGLDRQRADVAGQQLAPVPGLSSTTAAGLGRRITAGQWAAVEHGVAAVTGRMLALLPAPRAAALTEGPVTIDLDATDVEVYGRKKRGVAYNHQGQRVGRPHVATWAETETVLAADLGSGTDDPRASAPDLLRRALAGLPERARAGGRVAMRADAGYFAGQLARAAHDEHVAFAIGAKRIAPLWRLLDGISEDDWTGAIDMDGAQVTVAGYRPDWWPASTSLLIRRVKLAPEQVSADPRSRRRRTLHPGQRALPIPELASADAIYGYSFILTNLGVSTPGKATAAEHWYRHRTTIENIFRDSKHGAALRHLPLRLHPGQYGLDVGRAARRQHGRLAAPAHRDHPRPDHLGRPRRPRRQGHDRHPPPPAHRHPRPAHPARAPPDLAAAARPQPAARGPLPAAGPARYGLTTLSLSTVSPSQLAG